MAETWFNAKEWKARLVEFAGRRMLRNVANGETVTYDVSRSEGQVSQEGDAFNTKNMNDLEQRVANGFANAKTAVDTLSRDFETQLPDDVRIIHEGSGEDVKYYAQLGADTTSKKLLGRQPIDFITIVHGDSSWALTRLYIPDGYSKLDVYLERGAGSIYGYIGNEEEDPYGAKLGAISMTSQTFDLSEYVIVGIRADGNNARAHGHFY